MKSRVGAIIVAAGDSQRMGQVDKIFASLCGKPILAVVVEVFQQCSLIDEIIIVLSEKNLRRGRSLVKRYAWSKITGVCLGGARRQDSVREGLNMLNNCDWVVIHDGARPLITAAIIENGLTEALKHGAAIAGISVSDTIKFVSSESLVRETLRRKDLRAIQTPQIFHYDIISKAYRQLTAEVTDDAAAVEQLNYKVNVFPGSYENIKVTTREDLDLARLIMKKRNRE